MQRLDLRGRPPIWRDAKAVPQLPGAALPVAEACTPRGRRRGPAGGRAGCPAGGPAGGRPGGPAGRPD
eukprot:2787258-Pyramimonas_sp.AAC.1